MPTKDDIIEKGIHEAKKIIYKALWKQMHLLSVDLVRYAVEQYDGGDLTGNTITSIAAGVYDKDMPFPEIIFAKDVIGLKNPIWHKLTKNDVWIGVDYDGYEREGFEAKISTDEGSGIEMSFDFLMGYKLPSQCELGIVVCTGTEYSEYLTVEEDLKYDLLISSFKAAPRMAELRWKKIKVS